MAAYNYIKINYKCPSCNVDSSILCQTHFCSHYGGDETGRFHDRLYRLGEKMVWWDKADPRYLGWIQSNSIRDNSLAECCYSKCLNCNAELYVVINFKECTPIHIDDVGLEINWPIEYYG
jgi:hypothetical protein